MVHAQKGESNKMTAALLLVRTYFFHFTIENIQISCNPNDYSNSEVLFIFLLKMSKSAIFAPKLCSQLTIFDPRLDVISSHSTDINIKAIFFPF